MHIFSNATARIMKVSLTSPRARQITLVYKGFSPDKRMHISRRFLCPEFESVFKKIPSRLEKKLCNKTQIKMDNFIKQGDRLCMGFISSVYKLRHPFLSKLTNNSLPTYFRPSNLDTAVPLPSNPDGSPCLVRR